MNHKATVKTEGILSSLLIIDHHHSYPPFQIDDVADCIVRSNSAMIQHSIYALPRSLPDEHHITIINQPLYRQDTSDYQIKRNCNSLHIFLRCSLIMSNQLS